MKEMKPERSERVPPAANDNGIGGQEQPSEPLDPRIRIIARAIGRHLAREHICAGEQERRRQAANDNGQE
jgi:hypothetical protein